MPENRLENNRKIVAEIAKCVERNPDWRFHQVLQNLNINRRSNMGALDDLWYEESSDTYGRIACVH